MSTTPLVLTQKLIKSPRIKPNVMSLAYRYKHFGLGKRFMRKNWTDDCYWILTRLQPTSKGRYNRGMAYGIFVWKGKYFHGGEERRMSGINKPLWKIHKDDISSPWEIISK
eukprot:TRINITY_DN7068_c0_g1_i1.p1 TRINITY_DN7068_c0_g1~~TRINITY_DN7068_c0_g1_i1.p1  ORF type:complete len:111 (+),score=10.12 TRINITY_DN7068_c0_g1_i1:87-419(+)